MASMGRAHIRRRQTKSGMRYVVRYRLGGKGFPLVHAGSFKTMREATTRRDYINGELAAGRNPAESMRLTALAEREKHTLSEWAALYEASRVDYAPASAALLTAAVKRIVPLLGDREPTELTVSDVQGWVAGLMTGEKPLSAATIRHYMNCLRLLLDYAGVDPNPARDRRVKLPRMERDVVAPPTASEVAALISQVRPELRLPLRVLAETGLRSGELRSLEWQDVDTRASRFRLRGGKTAAARRWVTVPRHLMDEIERLPTPGFPEQGVFPLGLKDLYNAMKKACDDLGLRRLSPHQLRHHYASVRLAAGDDPVLLARKIGHKRPSLTLDVYGHVLGGEE